MSEGTARPTESTHSHTSAAGGPPQHAQRPMSHLAPATLVPESGWHFLHVYYRVDRDILSRIDDATREKGRHELAAALAKSEGVEQFQSFLVPGHKADFGFMAAGPDLRALNAIEMNVAARALGPALIPTYSFYSITEISEYVPDVAQYGEILKREGTDPESPTFKTKINAYEQRLGPMNKQRMYPEFPDWPCVCFYPMSKMREGDQNWYLLPFETRAELMSQHGKSGMKFAGKVTQVITASTGLDDWEWGVTLWSRNPSYLKDIVYTMRFDESSAKYALFGDFYVGMILPPAEVIAALRL